jgi:hypothetical protein
MLACACRVGANAGAGWKHEAQMLARCSAHPNIVSLFEVIEDTPCGSKMACLLCSLFIHHACPSSGCAGRL